MSSEGEQLAAPTSILHQHQLLRLHIHTTIPIDENITITMDFIYGLVADLEKSRCEKLQAPSYVNLALSM